MVYFRFWLQFFKRNQCPFTLRVNLREATQDKLGAEVANCSSWGLAGSALWTLA